MKRTASYTDLLLILTGAIVLLALLALGEIYPVWESGLTGWILGVLLLVFGAGYVLYVPGYLIQAVLFSHRDDLDGVERTGLSLGLSVALIPLLALLLDALPWGLRVWPIVVGEMGLITLFVLAAALRRWSLPAGQAHSPHTLPHPVGWWSGLLRSERWLAIIMAGALLLAGLTAAWVLLTPSDADFMTEFYILGPDGLAENFPRHATVGEPLRVTLGVTNLERSAQIYRVEVWVQDGWDDTRRQQVGTVDAFGLRVGENRESWLVWQMPWEGQDQQVDFLLFTGSGAEPYRRLRLWLDVSGLP